MRPTPCSRLPGGSSPFKAPTGTTSAPRRGPAPDVDRRGGLALGCGELPRLARPGDLAPPRGGWRRRAPFARVGRARLQPRVEVGDDPSRQLTGGGHFELFVPEGLKNEARVR